MIIWSGATFIPRWSCYLLPDRPTQMIFFENWCCIARIWRRLISWLSSIFATVLSLSLQLLSRLFRLLQDSQGNSHHKIDNLKSAHDWKSRKKSQSASDHRDLGHNVGFRVFRDPIHCWSVEEDVHYVQFELWFDAWNIYSEDPSILNRKRTWEIWDRIG